MDWIEVKKNKLNPYHSKIIKKNCQKNCDKMKMPVAPQFREAKLKKKQKKGA
jgi:hypothetical protein